MLDWRGISAADARTYLDRLSTVRGCACGMEQVPAPRRAARESLDEQARRKGAQPLRSADELRNDEVWESDEELAEFLAYLDVARRTESV